MSHLASRLLRHKLVDLHVYALTAICTYEHNCTVHIGPIEYNAQLSLWKAISFLQMFLTSTFFFVFLYVSISFFVHHPSFLCNARLCFRLCPRFSFSQIYMYIHYYYYFIIIILSWRLSNLPTCFGPPRNVFRTPSGSEDPKLGTTGLKTWSQHILMHEDSYARLKQQACAL